MDPERLNMVLEVFRSLPDYSFIWRCDIDIDNLPSNVLTSSWLPQQDILAHPNLRVFVTHGGIGSLTESLYHGAVMVGIPFSNDQKPNLLRAERHGYAVLLEWDDVTVISLRSAVTQAMESKSMVSSLDHMSRYHTLITVSNIITIIIIRIYKDREQSPAEKAVWWIEFVCRHGIQGTRTLRPINDQVPWYQYHHVDILTVLIITLITVLFTLVKCCSLCCCRRSKKQKHD